MKNVFFVAMLLIFSITVKAQTQTARADVRQGAQRARIHEGRRDDDLTRREATFLYREQRHIRRAERRAKADGEVTVCEKARVERKQDRASRHIRRAKHNSVEQKN